MGIECKCCKEVKDLSSFYLDKRSKNNIPRQPCKICLKIESKIKREKYSHQIKELSQTKVCNTCGIEKPRECFSIRVDTPSGLRSDCKECLNLKSKLYYDNNKEQVIIRTQSWAKENRLLVNFLKRKRYAEDPNNLIKDRNYRLNNKGNIKVWSKEYRSRPEVKSKLKIYRLKYESNPENKLKNKIASKRWRDNNKDLVCYYSSSRRARLKQATPVWACQDTIKSFYKDAQYFGESIDHIIPLNNPLVCGLHCEFNLQMIPLSDNIKKNNTFEIQDHIIPEWLKDDNL